MFDDLTGTEISYAVICDTKLWLYSHGIEPEDFSSDVKRGRQLHRDHYKRESRSNPDHSTNFPFDFIEREDGQVVVNEVKKSESLEEAHRCQILLYLYQLEQSGIDAIGRLRYPTKNKTETVYLTDKNREKLESIMETARQIIQGDMPEPESKPYCDACAYRDFCWGDES